jgi:hypothetical protein
MYSIFARSGQVTCYNANVDMCTYIAHPLNSVGGPRSPSPELVNLTTPRYPETPAKAQCGKHCRCAAAFEKSRNRQANVATRRYPSQRLPKASSFRRRRRGAVTPEVKTPAKKCLNSRENGTSPTPSSADTPKSPGFTARDIMEKFEIAVKTNIPASQFPNPTVRKFRSLISRNNPRQR